METAKIFKVIYSDVSEEMKNMVLDTALYEMGQETSFKMLTESYSDGLSEMLTDYVDLVAHNAVSEEDLEVALEQVLEAVDTETINIVAESFIDREVRRALFEREETINELFGFGKKSEERISAENDVKASKAATAEAGAKLKSALAAQKANLKAIKGDRPIGLAGLKRNLKTEQSDKLKVGRAQKEANYQSNIAGIAQKNLGDVKAKERKEAIDKVKGAAKSVWNKFTGAVKKGTEAAKNKAVETKDKAVGAVKSGVETAKAKAGEFRDKAEGAVRKGIAGAAGAVAKSAMNVANKAAEIKTSAETPKKSDKATEVTKTREQLLAQQKIHQNNLKDTELSKKQLAYQQKALDKVNAQLAALKEEALAEFTSILASSNISESSFDEIMEKVNSLVQKPEAKKIVGKEHRKRYEELLNLMQKKGDYSKEVQDEAQREGTKADKCGQ